MAERRFVRASILANKNRDSLTAKDVFDAYEIQDKLAIKVINNAIEYWGWR